jgi:hypothetical protein
MMKVNNIANHQYHHAVNKYMNILGKYMNYVNLINFMLISSFYVKGLGSRINEDDIEIGK